MSDEFTDKAINLVNMLTRGYITSEEYFEKIRSLIREKLVPHIACGDTKGEKQ